jgi:hypothetical protein
MNDRVNWAGLLACVLVSTLLGCGTGSDDSVAGSGGGAGTSSSGAGGGSSGGASAGDSSAGVGGTCIEGATNPPVSALISDFSDAVPDPLHPGEYLFGGNDASRVQGGTIRFANPASTPGTLHVSGGALGFSATVSAPDPDAGPNHFPFNGFALYVAGPACVDASAYTGVSFSLAGDLGSCTLLLSFSYAEDVAVTADPFRGSCTDSNCYPSEYAIDISTTSVNFADAQSVPGMPVSPVDTQQLVGVQWELVPPGDTSCSAAFTLSNVKFQ